MPVKKSIYDTGMPGLINCTKLDIPIEQYPFGMRMPEKLPVIFPNFD